MRKLMKKVSIYIILLALACGGGGEKQQAAPQEKESGTLSKSVLMVIAHRDFRDEEFSEPYELFRESGLKVTVASTDTTPAKGTLGMIVKPDILLESADADEFDGLVIVGGPGCRQLWDNATLQKIVQDFNAENKTIAAICMAPVILARAGILEDKIVTAYPTVRDEIGRSRARCTSADIEVSGNVITCSGPEAAVRFADTILHVLRQ